MIYLQVILLFLIPGKYSIRHSLAVGGESSHSTVTAKSVGEKKVHTLAAGICDEEASDVDLFVGDWVLGEMEDASGNRTEDIDAIIDSVTISFEATGEYKLAIAFNEAGEAEGLEDFTESRLYTVNEATKVVLISVDFDGNNIALPFTYDLTNDNELPLTLSSNLASVVIPFLLGIQVEGDVRLQFRRSPTLCILELTPADVQQLNQGQSVDYGFRIVDENGEPVPNVIVEIVDFPLNTAAQTNPTNADGETSYTAVVPSDLAGGTYDLSFTAVREGYRTSEAIVRQIEVVDNPVSIADPDEVIPTKIRLSPAYPNPFTSSTIIPFSLAAPSYIHLSVYNVLGQKVATLVSETLSAGQHTVVWDTEGLPGGVYFSRLQAAGFIQTRSLVLDR